MQSLEIFITDSVIEGDFSLKEDNKKIDFYKGKDDKFRYKVLISLSGPGTIYVQKVRYILHETFSPQIQEVNRSLSNPDCSLRIWTWGIFEVKAEIILKTGEIIYARHQLTFDKEIEAAKKQNIKFNNTGSSSTDRNFF